MMKKLAIQFLLLRLIGSKRQQFWLKQNLKSLALLY